MPTVTLNAETPARFAFGENWSRYVSKLTPERIVAAQQSLERIFGPDGLRGKTFLDLGCGSGLFSLAAHRMGAEVTSIDIDPASIQCAETLRERESADADRWQIQTGSALDEAGLSQLGTFDVVYSWGVLHHTGNMWAAIDLAAQRVSPGGTFWLAIYNDQGQVSIVWHRIKRLYVALPRFLQTPYVLAVGGIYLGQRVVKKLFWKLLSATPPADPTRRQAARGMTWWTDLVDWIGGYPFEVARPEDIVHFLRDRGFRVQHLVTCGGNLGCNEFVLVKEPT